MGIVTDLVYIIFAAVAGGFLARLFRQPLVVGYIFAGIVVGPHTGGLTVQHIQDIQMLAEVGVALLLFTLGLEFSFGELKRLSRITLIGAPLQILFSSFLGYYVASFAGLSHDDAIWIGAAISLSSTMVVLKTLDATNALGSSSGRIMLAVLIAQDLAVVPMMLLLPQLMGESINYSAIGWAIAKSAAFLIAMYFAGTRVFPMLFAAITRLSSRELFFLSILAVAFGAGYVSHELGLSFALGAFVAGMLLSETDFNHQALSDVASLRDLFALIFFASVGMLFDPRFFVDHFGVVLVLMIALVMCKLGVLALLLKALRYDTATAWLVGFGLSQVGEFAFVIASAGTRGNFLSQEAYSLMIAVTVLSMVATPGLFWIGRTMAKRSRARKPPLPVKLDERERSGHVVIIGAGVVGQYVARVLAALSRPYEVIEFDHKVVTQLRDDGFDVIFGDASQRIILEAAGVQNAALVVITTTNSGILPIMLAEVRQLNRLVPIVVRVEEIGNTEQLNGFEIQEVVQPQLEAGLEIVRQSLLALKISDSEILGLLGQLRSERYTPKRDSTDALLIDQRLVEATRYLELMWVSIRQSSPLAGKALRHVGVRERFGVSIVAVIKDSSMSPAPDPDLEIVEGDVIGVLGTRQQLDAFRSALC